ncbi:conjugal transfer protein TraD [Salmonella enterica subsp. enterica serovar Montevideo]|uniref:VirB3 family type IV secretion system protein n=1 Tax=Salmonella enterica TaxID=28901 RepID=UPI0009AFEFB9|nr:VirB3 family type IV secretion system protein [Salmonella enterica]EBZ2217486.1 conjugal transfer protein TraD [Salmonella enterica subsp. enterica serovar Montevideo]ECA5182806.1 conjugal transfer protein TraD [Salmonella enterica subsp. enterica serovar Newport]EDA8242614.1 conjugal transfer protein TraD [Salmonella enterica subsp. enterica serovar Reading]EAZ1917734.1 conjugal transfer protein TraD [Salmonella enterica]ECA9146935.1 conjugal transfer protein TraD [Salmonella enterica subs
MNDTDKSKIVFLSYNGLNRPAMVMGVPLMLLLAVGFLAVFGGFGCMFMWGISGVIFPALCFLFLFTIRIICENDPNALSVMNLQLKGCFLKVMHRDSIVGFSSVER